MTVVPNGVMEIGTNLNFVHQTGSNTRADYPTGDGYDTERFEHAFRDDINWSTAYDYNPNTGLSNTSPWRQEFLDDLYIYDRLRFVHWTNTIGSGISEWSQTTNPNSDQRQLSSFGTDCDPRPVCDTDDHGVAWEWVIDLGNRTQKDIWINVPLKANDQYVTELANLIDEKLDPNLDVYVEYTNELWNAVGGLSGDAGSNKDYATDMAIAAGIDNGNAGSNDNVIAWLAYRSTQIWESWRAEFGNDFDSRVVRVIANQSTNPDTGHRVLRALNNNLIDGKITNTTNEEADAYAIGPYFGLPKDDEPLPPVQTPEDWDRLRALMEQAVDFARQNVDIWATVNTPVITYEGGQHLIEPRVPFATIEAMNRDERMGAMYTDYLQGLQNAGVEEFNHAFHTGVKKGADYWGAKAYPGEPGEEAHKFAALATFGGHPINNPNPGGGNNGGGNNGGGDDVSFSGEVGGFDVVDSVRNQTTTITGDVVSDAESSISFTPLRSGPGLTAANSWYNAKYAPRNWNSNTLQQAINRNDYVTFTMQVNDNNVDLTEMSMRFFSQNDPRTFAVFSSETGFLTAADRLWQYPNIVGARQRVLDLSDTPELQDLTAGDEVEFRIYAYGNSNRWEAVGISNTTGNDIKFSADIESDSSGTTTEPHTIAAFDAAGSQSNVTTERPAETTSNDLVVSPITIGPGLSPTNAWFSDRFAPRGWESTTLNQAITAGEYLAFNVNIAPGASVDLTGISAYLFTQNNRPRNFALLSSTDNFNTSSFLSDFDGTVTGSSSYGQELRSETLSLSNLTGNIGFRIYVYGSQVDAYDAVGISNTNGFDLTLTGNVTS